MRIHLSLLLILLLTYRVHASEAKFYSVNSIYGVSMRETNSVCEDENGFVWASSKTGVMRLAEGDCRLYQLPYKTANVISTRLTCQNSSLIVYSNNGQVFVYDELQDCFNLYLDLREYLNNYINVSNICLDKQNSLWMATSVGLCRYKDGELMLVYEETTDVHQIVFYSDTHLLITTEKGIDLLNIHTLENTPLHRYAYANEIRVFKVFYEEGEERLWLGTIGDGLWCYQVEERVLTKKNIKGFPKQPVSAVVENTDSTLLVGFDGKGLWELAKEGERVLSTYKEDVDNPSSLRGDGVQDVLCDSRMRVWVATHSGGLSFFEQKSTSVNQIAHQINNNNSLGNNAVNKIIEDRKGDVWFATNNGISRWRRSSNQWEAYYQNKQEQAQVFLALCEDKNGNIWGGTYSSGVYVLDGDTGKELAHYSIEEPKDNFPEKFIFDIFQDSSGDIWIGGVMSVTCYFSEEKRFHSFEPQPVRFFYELSPGKLLLACTHGLLLLDKEGGSVDYLLDNFIQDILVIDNTIWVATCGDGLIAYDLRNGVSRKITTEFGLPSNFVNSILFEDGYLWLGTENGLCRFDPSDESIHTYSTAFSLSNVSFNVSSRCQLEDGNLMFGTNEGALLFRSDKLSQTELEGKIFFQDITVSGRSIRENPRLLRNMPVDKQNNMRLEHNENTVALELLPIGVSVAGAKFSWKMEGLDVDWNQPSDHTVINYTNIPSGSFQLRIRMHDSSLAQVIDERVLHITVTPPYWKMWWFRLLVVAIVAYIIYFSLKTYVNRLKQRHAEDKIRFFTNIAHDIRTSLTLINAPIEELNKEKHLSDKGHYYLDLAAEQSGRLSFVATQLLDFQKVDVGKGQVFLVMADVVQLVSRRVMMFEAAARKKNVSLEFSSDCESYTTAVDELKIEKVVDNLISNAIKYSCADNKVEIRFTCNEREWNLEVKDYGSGISESAQSKLFREFYRGDNVVNSKMVGSGIGLLLVKNYVSMHGGKVLLDSKENVGSSFRIIVPFQEVDDYSSAITGEEMQGNEQGNEVSPAQLLLSEEEESEVGGMHVLIVEDNNDLRDFLKSSFQEQYRISTASDGVEAWELIGKDAPDLIISDIMMPEMNGFELCRRIKSTFDTSHIPVILLTALSERAQQLEGLGLGADDYITKPFDMSLLMQRIKTIIKNREIVRGKAVNSTKRSNEPLTILTNELNDQFVKRALEVVNENIDNSGFGKEEFASAMNVSSSLLYKKIKALTGQSPIDFIKSIRLNHALELLQSHKHTVTEVSELCGFSSTSYFSTVFKKHFGKSPTEA